MVSEDQQKVATRKLTQWIENDNRIVTYRDISREVGCHVNTAKNLLLSHYNSNPSLSPTYLLTGPLLSTSTINQTQLHSLTQIHGSSTQRVRIVDMDEMSEGDRNSEDEDDDDEKEVGNDNGAEDGLVGDLKLPVPGTVKDDEEMGALEGEEVKRWGVVLVGKDGLEEKKKLFEQDTLNVHIHSLAPAPINDPAQYLIPNLTLREHKNYHNPQIYGTISGEAFRPTIPAVAEKKAMKDGGIDWSSKKILGGGKKEEVKKKEEPQKEETRMVDTKKPSSSTATKVTSKPASTRPTPAPASTQGSISGKKKRVINSDTEEDEPARPPKTATPAAGGSKKVDPTSSMIRADDQRAMEAMMSMDMDIDMELSDNEVKVKKEPDTVITTESRKVRKKRRVKKSKTVEDKKGRMVTKDYSTDESYTASETDEPAPSTKAKSGPAPTTKPQIIKRESTSSIGSGTTKTPAISGSHPPVKKATGGGTAKGQSTLKGFFTKK
ncbi:hypothetical protein L486_05738 [Kwoniella mangroviensis CBS 10435]|uniref:DNA polymerase delta subunit 3 n=1 Tax=Kwoniella mangroviensis CBS 10435 TaxID=1331196 RepID=A0A1B9IMU9_9TREE|nr:hypothetical protein L486_05738 [Kwoniella mangroviensis CBS 10435]